MTEGNPWVVAAQERTAARDADLSPGTHERSGGPTSTSVAAHGLNMLAPQLDVQIPEPGAGLLPIQEVLPTATVWIVGAHGGAGETSLAAEVEGWEEMHHAWPKLRASDGRCVCVLTARTSVAGLEAARRSLTQWASGALGGQTVLAGLVLIADAPGRLPKPLRDLAELVSGGAPRTWRIGWSEAWRLGERMSASTPSRELRSLMTDLASITTTNRTTTITEDMRGTS